MPQGCRNCQVRRWIRLRKRVLRPKILWNWEWDSVPQNKVPAAQCSCSDLAVTRFLVTRSTKYRWCSRHFQVPLPEVARIDHLLRALTHSLHSDILVGQYFVALWSSCLGKTRNDHRDPLDTCTKKPGSPAELHTCNNQEL